MFMLDLSDNVYLILFAITIFSLMIIDINALVCSLLIAFFHGNHDTISFYPGPDIVYFYSSIFQSIFVYHIIHMFGQSCIL